MESTRQTSSPEQTTFSFDAHQRVVADQTNLRAVFAAMLRKAGGADWLAEALDREPSYANKIGDAVNAVKDRKIQLEWMAPLLNDTSACEILLGWLSERCGYAPPIRNRVVAPEEENRALREMWRDMPEPIREAYRGELAKKLGIRPEDVKL